MRLGTLPINSINNLPKGTIYGFEIHSNSCKMNEAKAISICVHFISG